MISRKRRDEKPVVSEERHDESNQIPPPQPSGFVSALLR
jgi:hypothetical protein